MQGQQVSPDLGLLQILLPYISPLLKPQLKLNSNPFCRGMKGEQEFADLNEFLVVEGALDLNSGDHCFNFRSHLTGFDPEQIMFSSMKWGLL